MVKPWRSNNGRENKNGYLILTAKNKEKGENWRGVGYI
jgi:hypothetical protein